jgi:hypothetical protein
MALIGFIILIVFLLVILFYLLSMNKKVTKSSTKDLPKSNKKKLELNSILFPKNIENMPLGILSKATRAIFDSYKSLNYVNKLPSSLDKIEWHTWQLSILLVYLKNKNNLNVANHNIFHNLILSLSEEQLELEMQRILKKYFEHVDIKNSRDTLSKDVIWTVRDVSIILYKIVNNNKN